MGKILIQKTPAPVMPRSRRWFSPIFLALLVAIGTWWGVGEWLGPRLLWSRPYVSFINQGKTIWSMDKNHHWALMGHGKIGEPPLGFSICELGSLKVLRQKELPLVLSRLDDLWGVPEFWQDSLWFF